MDKASRTLVFLAFTFFLIISSDAKCKTRYDCHNKCTKFGIPTCVDGVCVCLAPKTDSVDNKYEKCKVRDDCHIKCIKFGLPTCVDGVCVCLATKTDSADNKGQRCKTRDDCHINCSGGEPLCVEGTCVCT